MDDESKPRLTLRRIIWIVACVVLLTSLFLIGAWLFKPPAEPSLPGSRAETGTVTEQEVSPSTFRPEGERVPDPRSASPAPPGAPPSTGRPMEAPAANVPPAASPPAKPPASPTATPKPDQTPPSKAGPKAESPGDFTLQVGAFSTRDNAGKAEKELATKGFRSTEVRNVDGKYKLFITGFRTREAAIEARKKLEKAGFPGAGEAFPVEGGR